MKSSLSIALWGLWKTDEYIIAAVYDKLFISIISSFRKEPKAGFPLVDFFLHEATFFEAKIFDNGKYKKTRYK